MKGQANQSTTKAAAVVSGAGSIDRFYSLVGLVPVTCRQSPSCFYQNRGSLGAVTPPPPPPRSHSLGHHPQRMRGAFYSSLPHPCAAGLSWLAFETLNAIRPFDDGMRACVRLDAGEYPDMSDAEQSLRRGCVLTPLLCNTCFTRWCCALRRNDSPPMQASWAPWCNPNDRTTESE